MQGFKDMRTTAELLLAPKVPLARSLTGLGSLKLGLGGLSLPGVISDASQLTGPIRNTLSVALKQKAAVAALSSSITQVLADFDGQRTKLQTGAFIPNDPLTSAKTTGVPTVSNFFTFSSLAPGAPIPASFTAIIDQRKKQLQQLAKTFSSVFSKSSFSGVAITENTNPSPNPQPDYVDKPDVPRLAQGGTAAQQDPILKDKVRFAVQGVNIGSGKPSFWQRLLGITSIAKVPTLNPTVRQIFKDRKNSGSWSEPVTPYAAQFPYNHVQQTESGHVIELDDTPGAERVHVFHRSGSFIEFHPDGSVVYKCMKNGYRVTMADEHVKVAGNCHVAIDGNSTLYVKGNVDMQTDGDFNVQAKGDFNVFAKNVNLRAQKTFKGDGTLIDLRYLTLPTSIMPVSFGLAPVGFSPRINLAAVAADTGITPSLGVPPHDINTAFGQIPASPDLTTTPVDVPPETPLSNWSVYTAQTPNAIKYRTRLFDTPEEVSDIPLYAGHASLQQQLGDTSLDTRQLGGSLRTIDTGFVAPDTKPAVDYLNFDDFKGNYNYANDHVLGDTSFTLADVSDLAIHPDVVSDTLSGTSFEDVPPNGGGGSGDVSTPTESGDVPGPPTSTGDDNANEVV
jgi:hypothetical protein